LPLPSLKKRKNSGRQEVQGSGSKRAKGSTPKKLMTTQDEEVKLDVGKAVVEEIIDIDASPEPSKSVQEKKADNPSKRSTRASGSTAAAPEVPKKKVIKRRPRKLKLSAEEEEELELDDAINEVEEFKEKEAAKEALLADSWDSFAEVVPDEFLDGQISKEELVIKLANQGNYKKVNFDEVPNYVINGPKRAKTIPYIVPIKNSFSKILSNLSSKTNCIEGAASASDSNLDETPVVSFAPSPESMRRFSETGVVSPDQVKNIEQEVPEVNAEVATSDALPQNISHEESIVQPSKSTNHASSKSNDSEKTISDQIHSPPRSDTVVVPVSDSGV
jgi:hypothetical protein